VESLIDCPICRHLPSTRDSKWTLADDIDELSGELFAEGCNTVSKKDFIHLVEFMDAVISGKDDLALWKLLYAYLDIHFHSTTPAHVDDQQVATLHALHEQWTSEYIGQSLHALKEKLTIYNTRFQTNSDLYARIMAIVQSSGTGKSRLVDELGGDALSISFTLRENGASGYPPGDPEIVKFLKVDNWNVGDKNFNAACKHARLISFLGAAVSEGETPESERYVQTGLIPTFSEGSFS